MRALLQYQRESLLRKIAGLDEAAARWSPVGSGTSLLWLVTHMAEAEVTWVLRRFAGLADDAGLHGGASAASAVAAGGAAGAVAGGGGAGVVEEAVEGYRRVWGRVDAVAFSGGSLDELCRRPDSGPAVSLRWVLMHLLEETARHAGHADIIRELIDGEAGR